MTHPTGPDALPEARDPDHPDTLVVAYAAAPYADTSAIVATKRIVQFGAPVDLIQHDLTDLRDLDPGLESLLAGRVRRRLRTTGRSAFGSWPTVADFTQQGLAAVRSWRGAGDPYARVWSRAHFIHSHVLAAVVRAEGSAQRWDAEFSDPLARKATGEYRTNRVADGPLTEHLASLLRERGVAVPSRDSAYQWAQALAFALADRLVFTNAAQRDLVLADAHPASAARARERSVIEPHPTLASAHYLSPVPEGSPRRAPRPARSGQLRIGYFGNLYASQSAGTVLDALGRVPRRARSRLRLEIHMGASGAPRSDLEREVAARGLEDVVALGPALPFRDFLRATTETDLLLALDARTPSGLEANPVLLSKMADYAGSGTPVWLVADPGSPTDLAYGPRVAHRTSLDDTTAAGRTLRALAEVAGTPGEVRARPPMVIAVAPAPGADGDADVSERVIDPLLTAGRALSGPRRERLRVVLLGPDAARLRGLSRRHGGAPVPFPSDADGGPVGPAADAQVIWCDAAGHWTPVALPDVPVWGIGPADAPEPPAPVRWRSPSAHPTALLQVLGGLGRPG